METVTEKLVLVTQHLPGPIQDLGANISAPIRELGISLMDEKCYTSLVEKLDFSDAECVNLALSKGLGIAIVVGGSIVKVPQITLILRTKDSSGLSLSANVLETLSYLITLFYSCRNSFPFSTYGENVFLGVQNIVVSLLTILYGHSPNASRRTGDTGLLTAFFVATIAALNSMSLENLAYLQLATLPMSLFAKVPQIISNYNAKSTGQLSAFAVISQIVGCVARLYTTSTEIGDPTVQATFGLALGLNVIIGLQMLMYWGNVPPRAATRQSEEKQKIYSPDLQVVDESLSQDYFLTNGGQRILNVGKQSEGSGKKWARKVD